MPSVQPVRASATGPCHLLRGVRIAAVWSSGLWGNGTVVGLRPGSGSSIPADVLDHPASRGRRTFYRREPVVCAHAGLCLLHRIAARDRPHRLSLSNRFRGSALHCLRHSLLSRYSSPAPDRPGTDLDHDILRVRIPAGLVRFTAGVLRHFPTVLAADAPNGRMDLRSLRKPQSLRRTDGNAGAGSAGFLSHP